MREKISGISLLLVAIMVMFLVPVGMKNLTPANGENSSDTASSSESFDDSQPNTTTSSGKITTIQGDTTTKPGTTTALGANIDTVITTPKANNKTVTDTKTTTKKTTQKATTTSKKTTTKTTTKKPAANKPASKGTPVANHGQLSVKGANIVDKSGKKFQLLGMSTHGIGWFPDIISKSSFKVLRDDWGCNSIRLAMYIEESWGGSESCYLADKDRNYKLVTNGIDYCIDLGMYVVVDWHVLNPGDPTTHTADAKEFFGKIAKKYKDYPNMIYELCNEPNGNVQWNNKIKPYCEELIKEIRKYDKDAIIVCGTATWSQDIDKVVGNTVKDKNTVYALHFYANTHMDWMRDRLKNCYNKGLPVLVTEFGSCDASGNGGFNKSETKKWFDVMDKLNIGYFNWSLSNKGETASAFNSGTDLSNIKSGTSQLTESGKLIREQIRKKAGM